MPEMSRVPVWGKISERTAPARPRIHWVSPLPPAATDIAHYTRRILPELTARADVVLWTDADSWDPRLERFCPVRRLDPARITTAQMHQAMQRTMPRAQPLGGAQGPEMTAPGAIFVHIGNSWEFHAGFLALARRIPAAIVLHDLSIQEMLFESINNGKLDRQVYEAVMRRWYPGVQGSRPMDDQIRMALTGEMSPAQLGARCPGFEIAMDHAVSMVTHTNAAHEAVTRKQYVPSYHLNLPFCATDKVVFRRAASGPLQFVQFGFIGPNRRLEQVLSALAGIGEDVDFVFDIVGKVWNPALIRQRCAELGLSDRVRVRGFVSEADLDALLCRAHLVFNLRHPTMGEASGSQLRIWNAGAASVVTDQGWYASLPESAAYKIPVEGEETALRELLMRLQDDRHMGEATGVAGYELLRTVHDPARYADGIVEIARAFPQDARDAVMAHASRRLLSRVSGDAIDLATERLGRFF